MIKLPQHWYSNFKVPKFWHPRQSNTYALRSICDFDAKKPLWIFGFCMWQIRLLYLLVECIFSTCCAAEHVTGDKLWVIITSASGPYSSYYLYQLIQFTFLLLMLLMILWLQPVDKQSFLDSGIFCCLIHVLNTLLAPDGSSHLKKSNHNEDLSTFDENDDGTRPARKLEVVFSTVLFLYFYLV